LHFFCRKCPLLFWYAHFKYLLWKSDPLHTLNVNEELQKQLKSEMIKIRTEYSAICFKIAEVYPIEPIKIVHKLDEETITKNN